MSVPSTCRYLRGKSYYVHGPHCDAVHRTSASSGYMCLRTQFVVGPDGAPCVPEDCAQGRVCYKSRAARATCSDPVA